MKLVIDIPEQIYKELTETAIIVTDVYPSTIERALAESTPYEERKTGKWNVITKCPMDADEIADWCEQLGYEIPSDEAFMYGNLPDEGEEVLVCTMSGTIFIDSLCCDEGCYFEEYGEMDGIVAWMPLPEPYKEADE